MPKVSMICIKGATPDELNFLSIQFTKIPKMSPFKGGHGRICAQTEWKNKDVIIKEVKNLASAYRLQTETKTEEW